MSAVNEGLILNVMIWFAADRTLLLPSALSPPDLLILPRVTPLHTLSHCPSSLFHLETVSEARFLSHRHVLAKLARCF